MSNKAQAKQILNHLEKGKPITAMQALNKFGCFRLAARIYDLRQEGYAIETNNQHISNGKHIAQYYMAA